MCVSILKYTPYLTDALDEDLVSAKFYEKLHSVTIHTTVYHSELNSVVHALDNNNCIVKLVCELFPLSMKANPAIVLL